MKATAKRNKMLIFILIPYLLAIGFTGLILYYFGAPKKHDNIRHKPPTLCVNDLSKFSNYKRLV